MGCLWRSYHRVDERAILNEASIGHPGDPVLKIYSVKIVLRGVSPMVWRRLQLLGDTSVAQFHRIIQDAMGWDDAFLHAFRIYGKQYGIAYVGGLCFDDDPTSVVLDDFDFDAGDRFTYTYNFFDDCVHDIRIAAIEVADRPARPLPRCLSGNGLVEPPSYDETDLLIRLAKLLGDPDATGDRQALAQWLSDVQALRFQRKTTNQQLLEVNATPA